MTSCVVDDFGFIPSLMLVMTVAHWLWRYNIMRLLNVNTLKFKDFREEIPPYAIASHRWYEWEPTKEDFYDRSNTSSPGCQKVLLFCRLVKQWDAQIQWLWIDTVCVDTQSSAEVSEVVQSMMRWYREARICFAYLHDVRPSSAGPTKVLDDFQHSVWFRRGWTLQELLAPKTVIFLTSNWDLIGHKGPFMAWPANSENLNDYIAASTGIPGDVLRSLDNLEKYSIEERIQWSHSRRTTRDEDRVYSVLGLLDVSMPVLYGEGTEKAVERLEDELTRKDLRARVASPRQASLGRTRALARANEHPPKPGPRPISSMSLPLARTMHQRYEGDERRHTTSTSTDPNRYAHHWTDVTDNLAHHAQARACQPFSHTPRTQSPSRLTPSSPELRLHQVPRELNASEPGPNPNGWENKPLPCLPMDSTDTEPPKGVRHATQARTASSKLSTPAPYLASPINTTTKKSLPGGHANPSTNVHISSALAVTPTIGRILQPFKDFWKPDQRHIVSSDTSHDIMTDVANQMITDLQHSLARLTQELEQQRAAKADIERQLKQERASRGGGETIV